MITDKETDFVYFSKTLRQIEYRAFLENLEYILKRKGVDYDLLSYTNDIWCRDYMPIQVSKDKFVQFKHDPIYPPATDAAETCKDIGIEPVKSKIKLDGGNVVKSKTKAIMTKRVVYDNCDDERNRRLYRTSEDLINALRVLLEVDQVILIPVDKYDPFGHADGMVRFLDGVDNEKDVLVKSGSKKELLSALKEGGLNCLETIPYDPDDSDGYLDASGIYINYLQVSKTVIYPTYGNMKKDEEAHKIFSKHFGDNNVIAIPANAIAREGGVLNCVSWNIRK